MSKTLKQLNARSIQLGKTAASLGENIHHHMVDIVEHVKEHGDTTAAASLLNVIPSAVRRKAIADWFAAFGGMSISQDGTTGLFAAKRNKKIPAAQIDIEAAKATTPWEFSKEANYKAFDLEAAIKAVLKRVENLDETPEGGKAHKVDATKLAALKAIVA